MTPDVTLTVRDPGTGVVPANVGKVQVKAGVSSKAAPNVLLSLGSAGAARTALGSGPLLDSLIQVLDVAGGPVLALPVLPSAQGTVTGAFTLTGSGSGTVTGSRGPEAAVKVKIGTGGTLGTATFQVAIGAGAYGAPVTTVNTPPWSYQVPGAYLTTLQFAAGTYVSGDVYTVNTDGTVSRVGTGTSTLLDGTTTSPVDAYNIQVLIMASGALGVGTFTYSLDGGKTTSASIAIPSGGKYVIPASGIVLTFSGTFTSGDLYTGTSTAPGYTTSDVNTALTALLANSADWGFVHLVGQPASAAAAASLAAIVDASMTAAFAAYRFVWGLLECPQAEGDSTIKTGFASFQSSRIGVAVGDTDLVSRLTSRTDRRNLAWSLAARLSANKLSTDPARFDLGALRNVVGIYRDESATPALDDARFITARTFVGVPGYYVTNFRLMSAPGSDFTYGMNRRVMDRLCVLARQAYLQFLNADVLIDQTTGYIDERDAQRIDGNVDAKLETLLSEGEASAVASSLSRTDNLLASGTVNAEIACVPKGYLKQINVTLGFVNPAIRAAA